MTEKISPIGPTGAERSFTVELRSRDSLKNVCLADGAGDRVLVEGTLGELVRAYFAEGVVLEVVGSNGVLRMDLSDSEIRRSNVKTSTEVSVR